MQITKVADTRISQSTYIKKKRKIQKDFWDKLGLHVNMPRVGGFRSTNDGNTARRSVAEHDIFSEITDVDKHIISLRKIILIGFSCYFETDSNKSEIYCFETAKRF